jgi:hypothetical protein
MFLQDSTSISVDNLETGYRRIVDQAEIAGIFFCVVSESAKDERLLEKDAQLLVNGSDAYGCHLGEQPRSEVHRHKIIVPVIVTNAKLFIASYDPADVSLDTGELLPSATEISSIPWVRFTKSFSGAPDIGDSTVFVVSANSLRDFLENLEMIRDPL